MSKQPLNYENSKGENQLLLTHIESDLSPPISQQPRNYSSSATAQTTKSCSSSDTDNETDMIITHCHELNESFNDQMVNYTDSTKEPCSSSSLTIDSSEDTLAQVLDTTQSFSFRSSSMHRPNILETNQVLGRFCQNTSEFLEEERGAPVNDWVLSKTPERDIHQSNPDLESSGDQRISTPLLPIGLACQAVTKDCFHYGI